jgi:adenylylsulfate kinase
MTGLPGSGKTTLAMKVKEMLKEKGKKVEILDGDDVRKNLSPDLGFSAEDRILHNKRVIHMAKMLSKHGITVVVSLISPYRAVRDVARAELSPDFVEVFVKCPLEECMGRDPKGLYAKAKRGEIKKMTGYSDTYEEPLNPELVVETDRESVEECAAKVVSLLRGNQ